MRTSEHSLDHVVALDGLRFVVAAVVWVGLCWDHLAEPLDVDIAVRKSLLAIFISGCGAVYLFLILGGFA